MKALTEACSYKTINPSRLVLVSQNFQTMVLLQGETWNNDIIHTEVAAARFLSYTHNILSCRCTRAGVSKLVYLSEVVGKAEKVPMQRVTGQRKQTIHYTSMTLAVGQEKSITI